MTQPTPLFTTRSFQLDLGRQPESLATLKRVIDAAARFGFNQCHLYLENSLKLKAFGAAGKGLEKHEVTELVNFAAAHGVEIVPSINLLGHVENFLAHDEFKHMDEAREGARQPWQQSHNCLCPSLPQTREWVARVIAEIAPLFPSPNLHVGLDETWMIGSCRLCREWAAEIGLGGIFASHASYLNTLVKAQGKTMWMWADMCFYYDNVIGRLPRDIVMVDWNYEKIGAKPLFSFRNWRAIDSTAQLAAAGFRVVPAGHIDIENVRTFARYATGLGCDTFLVTEWEGSLRYRDAILPTLCATGHFLTHGALPDWQTLGEQLLPGMAPIARHLYFLGGQYNHYDPRAALDGLRLSAGTLLSDIRRAEILQSFIRRELSDLAGEIDLAARQALRRNAAVTPLFAPLRQRLSQTALYGVEWLELLQTLATAHGEDESARGLYKFARNTVREIAQLQEQCNAFCGSPSAATFPGAPVCLTLCLVGVDPSAHACTIMAGDDPEKLQKVYDVSILPIGMSATATVNIPLQATPHYIRLSINGYARVGVSNLLCRTPEADMMPAKIVACGGNVIDARHLLDPDRKAAFFNEPDIAAVWRQTDPQSDNFVLLQF